jgi:hopanoid biosynthesis associated RND transporter like protein HpnN
MLTFAIVGIVRFCSRFPWLVIALSIISAAVSVMYAATHFHITTDISNFISPDLDWRKREFAFEKDFPGHFGSTLVVVDAPSTELVSAASAALAEKLSASPDKFRSVQELTGGEFFSREGLLFRSKEEVAALTQGLGKANQLVSALAEDPSLRGLTEALSLALLGVEKNMTTLDALARPLSMASDSLENLLAGRPAVFSWQEMLSGARPGPPDLRRFIAIRPVLDFSSLEPGRKSSDAIRQAASDLQLDSKYQARIRLTGTIPMADEEFATVRQGALVNGIGTLIIVLTILWMALKSARMIVAVFINLFVGLAITAALGLAMVGALNLISVAFAVLFVGIGVDFAIQFSVRYRSERHRTVELRPALVQAAQKIGAPLTLAAAAVAAGFLSFLPTHYRGVSELGQIAGVGMLVAYGTSITLLPALLTLFNPPGEREPIGYRSLAPVDRFLQKHRIAIIAGTLAVAAAGSPLLYFLTFDFNPIHLRSSSVESVSTFLEMGKDRRTGINAINVVASNTDEAKSIAAPLRNDPQVLRTTTLEDLVPADQPEKLAMIKEFDRQMGPILRQKPSKAPTDDENIAALTDIAGELNKTAGDAKSPGADAARRLADACLRLAKADKASRDDAQSVFVTPLKVDLAQLRNFLRASPVTKESLPPDLKRQWETPDGRARVEVVPKGDPNDTEIIRSFARKMLSLYPTAIGVPISILESGDAVVAAFIQAGLYALLSITILLWIALRRFGDVLLTLVPLLVAGAVTLEICVLIGMPLNFANIIALPLLLGIGVAFKIYYIMAWRAGQMNLLQSSLTRAVIWSALTTATAFGSLWLSSHPGTSSMGKLLALSLICTLCAAVLFQPALMGRPRGRRET